ncbi:MAG TPA: four helix bundle protein [Ignavibacteriaceae bacterium]|nr:four helix bundle protein [Ignavibacteriaceae bacterium]
MERTFNFGVNCLLFIETLPKTVGLKVAAFQLAKSSTSVGANYEEAQRAESGKDFIHKIGIVLKEICESNYWLRVIGKVHTESSRDENYISLLNESFELKKIFISIKLTAQQNLKKVKC